MISLLVLNFFTSLQLCHLTPTDVFLMEDSENFNQLLKSNLSKRTAKKDFPKTFETCKNVLRSEINVSKDFGKLFQEETWEIFSSAIEGIDSANEDLKRVTLELLQLFTIITPKGMRRM